MDKKHIINEIKRLAQENNGQAPGRAKFERETGIGMKQWYGVFWPRWGDAVEEAGFSPNAKQEKIPADEVLKKFAEAVSHFKKIPTEGELRIYSRNNKDFPGHSTFNNHFGSKQGTIAAFANWVKSNSQYSDLEEYLPKIVESTSVDAKTSDGFVYLLQSGIHYKIGRSENLERRVKQITVALPEEVTLVHAIRTDDPAGIEAYWHKRFSEKRANGEWFKLSNADLRAFKRRKFQ